MNPSHVTPGESAIQLATMEAAWRGEHPIAPERIDRHPTGTKLLWEKVRAVFARVAHSQPKIVLNLVFTCIWEGEAPSEPALFGGRVFESSEHRV